VTKTYQQNADPERRLRAALRDVYGWYERVESAVSLFVRDASLVPAHRAVMKGPAAERAAIADRLASDFRSARTVRAAIGHALEFETWRSLAAPSACRVRRQWS